jgi:outer membrane lipoprotein-sorting protein
MTNHNQSAVPSPEFDSLFESAVWSVLAEPIDRHAIERVKISARRVVASTTAPRSDALSPVRRRRRALTLVGLAAGLLLAIGATLFVPSAPTAFAQAIEQLKAARAFSYTTLIYTDQREKPITSQVMFAADGRERSESSGIVSIMDANGWSRITLIKATKTAIVAPQNKSQRAVARGQLDWLEKLKSHGSKPDRELGSKQLNGRSVEGFAAKQGQIEFTIWVDSNSKELVQIEHPGMIEGSPIKKVVMNNFHFNQIFDESLFSFEVPNDYQTIDALPPPQMVSHEESIIEALRGYTKVTDGKFPKSLADWGEWSVIFSRSGVPREETTVTMARLGAIAPFLFSMSKEDYQYLGAGKTTSDEHTIVFWYRTKDGQLRAIFNDLSAADINEADVPKGDL